MPENTNERPIVVAIVEDMPVVAESLRDSIEEALGGSVRVIVETNFDNALGLVSQEGDPEAFVLDWFEDDIPEQQAQKGEKIWDRIWKYRLVPVVIYSAHELVTEPPIPADNPLLRYVRKGEGSDEQVIQFLKDSRAFILAMRETQSELNATGRAMLLTMAPKIWHELAETDTDRSRVLLRTARRRLAAALDEAVASTGELLDPWEQYIFPSLGDSLLTGDLLRSTTGPRESPASFRLVLTPSCDLQLHNGECKVESVLCATCSSMTEFLQVAKVGKGKKREERLPMALREPQVGGFIPLPKYADLVPMMAADLRHLELIRIKEIAIEEPTELKYVRVLSIDSPFREQVAWAYLQITGRPGLPEREFAKWVADIPADDESN